MRTIRAAMLCLLVLGGITTAAWGQYTLYGAPDVLRLPNTQTGMMQPAYQAPPQQAVAANPAVAPVYPAYGRPAVPVNQTPATPYPQPIPESEPGAPMVERPSVVQGMLAESGAAPAAAGPCNEAACGESCAPAVCAPEPCCPWFGMVGYLTMGRDHANRVWTTFNSDILADQMTNTNDIDMDWGNGGEVRFGRRFCTCSCNPWALEAVYWTMDPVHGYISTVNPTGSGHVSTPLDFDMTDFDGTTGGQFFDDAAEHRLWRRNEFHNVELNMLRGNFPGQCCIPSWNAQWLLGVRWFRFNEDLRFGSLMHNHTWGEGGGVYEAYLDDHITNDLVGVQVGFDARSNRVWNLQLYVAPKVGLYNNHIENKFGLYRGDGLNATSLDPGGSYPVDGSDNVFSVLAELDLGVYWHVTQHWSANVGYRLMAMSAMGLADSQIIHYVNDVPEYQHVKYNGDLLLHGGYAGVAFNY
jgi:hypothetical protein